MELGALVCVPKQPRCALCPIAGLCLAKAAGREMCLPVKAAKRARRVAHMVVLLIRNPAGELLLRRRTERLLQGMWVFALAETGHTPGVADAEAFLQAHGFRRTSMEPLGDAVHVFTHLEWHMTGYLCRVEEEAAPEGYQFVPPEVMRGLAIPSAVSFYRAAAL